MKNQKFATLKQFKRLNNSINGNPNYEVALLFGDDGYEFMRSSSDSSWCYGISGAWLDKTVAYTTTKSGRINYMKLATIQDTFTDPILSTREGK